MRKLLPYIMLFSLFLLQATPLWASESTEHQIYKLRYYTLGSVFNSDAGGQENSLNGYQSLLIMDKSSDILTSEYNSSVSMIEAEGYSSNNSGVAFSARIDATDRISVLGAFGMNRNYLRTDGLERRNESSWEANLGLMFKFISNLSYELHLGYMDPGDLFTERSSYTDVEHVIMVSNRLTMSF
jgi:hypothetical protein